MLLGLGLEAVGVVVTLTSARAISHARAGCTMDEGVQLVGAEGGLKQALHPAPRKGCHLHIRKKTLPGSEDP